MIDIASFILIVRRYRVYDHIKACSWVYVMIYHIFSFFLNDTSDDWFFLSLKLSLCLLFAFFLLPFTPTFSDFDFRLFGLLSLKQL